MPFVMAYAVNFGGANLHPTLDLKNWPDTPAVAWLDPDMKLSPKTANDLAERSSEPLGLRLRITRRPTIPPGASALNSVYLVPPSPLPLDIRLFMRVTFDLPFAEGFTSAGELEPTPPLTLSPDEHGSFATEAELPDVPMQEAPGRLSVTEPWAVALSLSPTNDLLSDHMVNVTCQFSRKFNGVRLNTPKDARGIGALQTDKGACLERPLNYDSYQSGYMAFPDGTDGEVDPPIFTLEHSFCGWNANTNGHTPGSGLLKIRRTQRFEVQDHRVFSSNSLVSTASIGALGISLVTRSGVGRLSVRLRTFSLWFNYSI